MTPLLLRRVAPLALAALALLAAPASGQTRADFATGLDGPTVLVRLADGRVLVAEANANRVSVISDADGNPAARADFATGLSNPVGLLQLADGRVLVVETNGVSVISDAAGNPTARADYAIGLSGPIDLFQLTDGRVLVAEVTARRVSVVSDAVGNPAARADYATGLSNPNGLAQLADGRVLVAEANADRVSVISDAGRADFATGLTGPVRLAQLADGRVLVAEISARRVSVVSDADGNPAARADFAAGLSNPNGLAQLADGRVLVAESRAGRVSVVSPRTAVAADDGEGFYLLAAPADATTVGSFFGPVWTQCFPGADYTGAPCGTSAGVPNVYTYDESAAGGAGEGYAPASASDPLPPGRGVYAYLYADDDATTPTVDGGFPKALPLAGAEPALPFEFALTYTDTGADDDDFDNDDDGNPDGDPDVGVDDGWNLLGNPLRRPLDWPSVYQDGATVDVNPTAYVYRPGAGYLTVNGDTGAGTLQDQAIPVGRGFYVLASGPNPALVAPAPAAQPRRSGAAPAPAYVSLRVASSTASGREVSGSAYVAVQAGAALGADPDDGPLPAPLGAPHLTLGVEDADGAALLYAALPSDLGDTVDLPLVVGLDGVGTDAALTPSLALPGRVDGGVGRPPVRRGDAAHGRGAGRGRPRGDGGGAGRGPLLAPALVRLCRADRRPAGPGHAVAGPPEPGVGPGHAPSVDAGRRAGPGRGLRRAGPPGRDGPGRRRRGRGHGLGRRRGARAGRLRRPGRRRLVHRVAHAHGRPLAGGR